MSYPYLIVPDIEEGHEANSNTVRVAYNENQVEDAIRALSSVTPNATLCIYRLHELRKIKTRPTYSVYTVNDKMEIVPK